MKTMSVWEVLDGTEKSPLQVGGKGAWLNRLVAIAMPVPPAAVLNVDAYHRAVEQGRLDSFLGVLPADVDPDDLAADGTRVDRRFLNADLPKELRRAIEDAYWAVSDGGPVAVRSSATAEDLSGASFAGQYRTLLGVGSDDVVRAVRLCWASLWAPGARAYRKATSIPDHDVGMAVIIQRMVPAQHSGVVFTIDPTTAARDLARVEVVKGLGENLVSGRVTPKVFHVRRDDRRVVEPHAPRYVRDAAAQALAIEEAFGAPQDVEWAVAGGELHIVQARPITTAGAPADDGFDTTPFDGVLFSPTGVAEMLPGVLPPLLWTINAPLVEHGFSSLFETLKVSVAADGQPIVGRFRGRAALNLTLLKKIARMMPGGSGAEVERQYLGRVVSDENDGPVPIRHRMRRLGSGMRSMRVRREAITDAETFIEAVDLVLSVVPDHGELTTDALLEYRHRLRDVARHGVAAEVAVSAATAANYRSVEKALERDLGAEGASLAAQRLTAGAAGTKLAGFAGLASVWECHSDVLRLDQIAQAVYDGPLGETEDRIRALGASGDAFLRDVDRRLHVAGSRALYGGETWAERRRDVWAALRRARGQSPDNGPAARVSDAGADAAQFRRELDGQLRGARRTTRILTGQVVDVRRRLLRRIVDDARLFLGLRESVKSSVLRLGGEERRVDVELASRLVDVGLLDRPDDVELLSDAELDARAAGGSGPSLRELFERRAAVRAAESAGPLPEAFRGTPDADPLDASGAVENPNDRRVLSGWAASPGRVTGRARVVRRLAEGHDLAPGEILVGHTSDPSWSLLFTTAAAIVMEAGGPLSHAAIIAREFRVPAVLNVRGATRLLPSGTPIAVDGTTGQIEILDDNLTEDQP